MVYRIASQIFLGLAVIGFIGWVIGRLMFRPIFGVSYDGFLLLATTCVGFVIAIALYQLAFENKK